MTLSSVSSSVTPRKSSPMFFAAHTVIVYPEPIDGCTPSTPSCAALTSVRAGPQRRSCRTWFVMQ